MDHDPQEPQQPLPLSPEDYYLEGPYIVFTEAYHRRRGYCCASNCRHCPYREPVEPDRGPGQSSK
jgi:hypothetical protein